MKCVAFVLAMLTLSPLAYAGGAVEGTVSWYDSNSVNREGTCREEKCYTASGKEIHQLEKDGVLFIASNSIKLRRKVRVCDANGQRCEEAIVLDRGGFKKYGRQADLCRKLFAKFAPLSKGLTTVTIKEIPQ